jgi:hypothetical protein
MPELRELAFRIARALSAEGRRPVCVDLWHQSPEGAAYLIAAVIDECRDAGVGLATVKVDSCVGVALGGSPAKPAWSCNGTSIEIDGSLFQRVEFYRPA